MKTLLLVTVRQLYDSLKFTQPINKYSGLFVKGMVNACPCANCLLDIVMLASQQFSNFIDMKLYPLMIISSALFTYVVVTGSVKTLHVYVFYTCTFTSTCI